MKSRTFGAAALAVVATMTIAGSVLAADHLLDPFTQAELDTDWQADRQFPSGGVTSVSEFGRTDVARIGIDSANPSTAGTFRLTEGIKTVGAQDFGQAVQVDLYLDPDWADTATRAGMWVVGDDGAGERDELFGIIEFVHNDDHEGWRIWDSSTGWTNVATSFTYGQWTTLSITLDATAGAYSYAVDGVVIGTATGGNQFIREVFLNSYNFGSTTLTTVNNDSYAAHWHAGLTEIDSKDQCKDGNWEEAGFKNQGQCIRFVNTGKDSR